MATLLERQTKEPCLTIDEYNKPRTITGREAIGTLIAHIIEIEPGTYSNKPELGVGIKSRYRYNDKESLKRLAQDIKDQINTYLPEFNAVDVTIDIDRHRPNKTKGDEIVINIRADGVMYKYETAQQDIKIDLNDLNS